MSAASGLQGHIALLLSFALSHNVEVRTGPFIALFTLPESLYFDWSVNSNSL